MRINHILSQRFKKHIGELVGEMTVKSTNLPRRYIERTMEQVYWRNPRKQGYAFNKVSQRTDFKIGMYRPWEPQFYQDNMPHSEPPKVYIEPIIEWSFFKGDRVEILEGPDKGKQGLVNYIVQERNWVTVAGLNCKYVYEGKTPSFPGVLRKVEEPLLVTSGVALVDPSDGKPTNIEWRYTEDGNKVRVSLRSERVIPMPRLAEETIDYKTKNTYSEQPKDTTTEHLTQITFQPCLKTFEMDIMESMGIEEDRVPAKTYWY